MNAFGQIVKKARRKQSIDFGNSRRSYILDRSLVIDHKTGKRTGDVQRVLDGDLDVLRSAIDRTK